MGSIYTQKLFSEKPYRQKGFSNKDFLHPVTRAYVQKFIAAGVRIPPDIEIIDKFVRQLSAVIPPQFWNCWLLRSNQNAGTGTTVYSLGNAVNGTLTGSPSWGTNGVSILTTETITFTGASLPATAPISIDIVLRRDNTPVGSNEIFFGDAVGSASIRHRIRLRINNANKVLVCQKGSTADLFTTDNSYTTDDNFTLWSARGKNTSGIFYRNTTPITMIAPNGTYDSDGSTRNVTLQNANSQQFTCPFIFYFNFDATSLNSVLYNIYKNTILAGLLP